MGGAGVPGPWRALALGVTLSVRGGGRRVGLAAGKPAVHLCGSVAWVPAPAWSRGPMSGGATGLCCALGGSWGDEVSAGCSSVGPGTPGFCFPSPAVVSESPVGGGLWVWAGMSWCQQVGPLPAKGSAAPSCGQDGCGPRLRHGCHVHAGLCVWSVPSCALGLSSWWGPKATVPGFATA